MKNCCENGISGYGVDYDTLVEKSGYVIPEVLFGLMYELVQPGSSLLDIATGTGRVAKLFRKAGIVVHGMDKSKNMLKICKHKINYESLAQHDLFSTPYPYESESMNYISCVGILNHVEDLSVIFSESSRILCKGGYFGFMTGYRDEGCLIERTIEHNGGCIQVYDHTDQQINEYMGKCNFGLLRSLQTSVNSSVKQDHVKPVKIYVVQKN